MPMPAFLRSIGPWQAGAVLFLVTSLVLLVAVIVLTIYRNGNSGVLGDYDEAEVLSSVPGIEEPAVRVTGQLSLGQTRCVHGGKIVSVEVTIIFERLDDGTPARVPYLISVPQTRAPGCNYQIANYPLPQTMTAGTWRATGISRSTATGEVRYWASEPFLVVNSQ